MGSGHGGNTHHDPPTDHSFAPVRHIHTTDPSASVTMQAQSLDVGLDDVDFNLSMIGWMNFLTRDYSTSMPSHLVSPLGLSLLGCFPATSHASVDARMELDEAQ